MSRFRNRHAHSKHSLVVRVVAKARAILGIQTTLAADPISETAANQSNIFCFAGIRCRRVLPFTTSRATTRMRCSSTEKGSAGRLRRCAPAATGMKAGALGHVYVNFPIKKQASLLLRLNQRFAAALWSCSTPVGGVLPWLLFLPMLPGLVLERLQV